MSLYFNINFIVIYFPILLLIYPFLILLGMWYSILEFLNYVGVITNAFIIAFTSQWGKEFSTSGKLWIVIGFEVSNVTISALSEAPFTQLA